MGWNLPDGVTPAMIDALYVDEDEFDREVDEIAEKVCDAADKADRCGCEIDWDGICDWHILDDQDYRDRIVQVATQYRHDKDERNGLIREIVDEAADLNLDMDEVRKFNYYYYG